MWFSFGLAGFVLLIAFANLAHLQLVRSNARMREHSVRASLGSPRFRLLRLSMTESLVVAFLGGTLSLLLAYGAIGFINSRLFASLPGASVTVDFTVFGFAFLMSLLTGVLFGTMPAWLASEIPFARTELLDLCRCSRRKDLCDHQRGRAGGT